MTSKTTESISTAISPDLNRNASANEEVAKPSPAATSRMRGWMRLFLFFAATVVVGCEQGAEIVRTTPADGAVDVSRNISSIEVEFSTNLEDTLVDSEGRLPLTVTGSISGLHEIELALSANEAEEEARLLTITDATTATFLFSKGEVVTVKLTSRLVSPNGRPVQSDSFSFTIEGNPLTAPFEPGDSEFIVAATTPESGAIDNTSRPSVRVEFDQPAVESTISSSDVIIRGGSSGVRSSLSLTYDSTQPASTISGEQTRPGFVVELDGAEDGFDPGERVWVTVLNGIEALPPVIESDGDAIDDPVAADPDKPADDPIDPTNPVDPNNPSNPAIDDILDMLGDGDGAGDIPTPVTPGNRVVRPYVMELYAPNGVPTGFGSLVSLQTQGQLHNDLIAEPLRVVAGDFHSFQHELVVLDASGELVHLSRVNPVTFKRQASFALQGIPVDMQTADLDGDGRLEVIVLVDGTEALQVFDPQGTSWLQVRSFGVDGVGNDLELTDLNGDGELDAVVSTDRGIRIALSIGETEDVIELTDEASYGVEVGDFDRDGRIDLLVGEGGGLVAHRNAGSLNISSELRFIATTELIGSPTTGIEQVTVADFDGDADLDVVLTAPSGLSVYLNEGATLPLGGWQAAAVALDGGEILSFLVADLDGDGANDLAAVHADPSGADWTWRRWTRDGDLPGELSVADEFPVTPGMAAGDITSGDINGDGGLDLIFANIGLLNNSLLVSYTAGVDVAAGVSDVTFKVPPTTTAAFGSAEYVVTVSADLASDALSLTVALGFDDEALQLEDIRIVDGTFVGGVGSFEFTIMDDFGAAEIIPASTVSAGTDIPLVEFVFSLNTPAVGNYLVQLQDGLQGPDTGDPVFNNRVELVDGGESEADIISAGTGVLQVSSSLPSVTNLTCEPTTNTSPSGVVNDQIQLSWVNGAVYGQVLIRRIVNGQFTTPISLSGSTVAYLLPVQPGEVTYLVSGVASGSQSLESAPTECAVDAVASVATFSCSRDSSSANPEHVRLQWTIPFPNPGYTSFRVLRDGSEIADLDSSTLDYTDDGLADLNGHYYELIGVRDLAESGAATCEVDDQVSGVAVPSLIQAEVASDDVTLFWDNAESYTSILISRNTLPIATGLPGFVTEFTDSDLPPGTYTYSLTFSTATEVSSPVGTTPTSITTLLPAVENVACELSGGSNVTLTWSNPPQGYTYDSLTVVRQGPDGTVTTDYPGTTTVHTDSGLSEGTYSYQIEGVVGGFTSVSESCEVALETTLSVPNVVTTFGVEALSIDVTAQLLAEIDTFEFTLRYDSSRFDLGADPVVLLPSGVVLSTGVTDVAFGTGSEREITIEVAGVTVTPGDQQVLATIVGASSSDFTALGNSPLDLVEGELGTDTDPVLVDGVLVIVGDALQIEEQTVSPGDLLEFAVYGTFDQAISGFNAVVGFDPAVLTFVEATREGTPFDVDDGFAADPVVDAAAGYASVFAINFFTPAPAGVRVPVYYFRFEVSPLANAGSDTGLRLIPAAEIPDGVPVSVFSTVAGASIQPLLLNGPITVADGPQPPFLAQLSVDEGDLLGGVSVSLLGSNLTDGAGGIVTVTFGGVAATVVNATPTQVDVTIPAASDLASVVDLLVDVDLSHSLGITVLADAYTYRAPFIASVAPAVALAGVTATLSGGWLPVDASDVTVSFGGVEATDVTTDGSTLTATVPAGVGVVDVLVELAAGQQLLLPGAFTYVNQEPALSGISGDESPLAGGIDVTLTGFNLDLGLVDVLFGSEAAAVVAESATSLTVTVPTSVSVGTDETVDVTVTTSFGTATLAGAFTYRALNVTGLDVAQGSPSGGEVVSLLGAGFVAAGANVTFGSAAATILTVSTDFTQLSVETPPLALGDPSIVSVVVTLADGQTQTLVDAFEYNDLAVDSISPTAIDSCGDQITITGSGFAAGVMTVEVGGVPATVDSATSTEIVVTTPVLTEGLHDVEVTHTGLGSSALVPAGLTAGVLFIRGDVNDDGFVDVVDLSLLANYLLGSGGAPANLDTADINDDGLLNVGDVVVLSSALDDGTVGSLAAPAFPTAGIDPTADGFIFACP